MSFSLSRVMLYGLNAVMALSLPLEVSGFFVLSLIVLFPVTFELL